MPKGDKQIAKITAQHLLAATKTVKDPQLRAEFSQALAALHAYLAQDNKEHKAALAGKISSTPKKS